MYREEIALWSLVGLALAAIIYLLLTKPKVIQSTTTGEIQVQRVLKFAKPEAEEAAQAQEQETTV